MSVASSVADKFSPASATTLLRLAACLRLAAFVIAVGPPTRIARTFGWRFARGAPVLFQRFLCAGLGVRVRRHGRIVETVRGGSPVVLFAEATTGDGNRLMRFRSSHFEAIRQAAAGDSRLAGLPIARGERPRVAWYGDITFFDHFFRYIRGPGVTCDVYCGTPIPAGPGLDRKSAARLTEAAVRELAVRARASHSSPIFPGPESAYIGLRPFWSP